MTDKIVDPDSIDWDAPINKGKSKYDHLLDGQARILDIRDYDHTSVENIRITLAALARKRGLRARARKQSEYKLAFQVIGKIDE